MSNKINENDKEIKTTSENKKVTKVVKKTKPVKEETTNSPVRESKFSHIMKLLGNYFSGIGKDIKRGVQDNPSIIWALLLVIPGIFIGLFLTSHIRASYALTTEYRFSGIMLFIMLLAGCLNIVNAFAVKGKRNMKASVNSAIVTAIIVFTGSYWVYCLIICDNVWVSRYSGDAVTSIVCIMISIIGPLVGCIGSFFTRNKNYKKETL